MKKVLMSFTIGLFTTFANGAETEGFRNLLWGSEPSALGERNCIDTTGQKKIYECQKKNDSLKISTAKLDYIMYAYFDNKLMAISIDFHDYSNFDAIKEAMISKYGQPIRPNEYMDKYFWPGDNTSILLDYKVTNKGNIFIMNRLIQEELDNFNKQVANEAKKDF